MARRPWQVEAITRSAELLIDGPASTGGVREALQVLPTCLDSVGNRGFFHAYLG
jgi:hypothetical protein